MSDSESKLDIQAQRVLDDPKRSALQKYALLAVGDTSLFALLKYELVTGLFSGCAGAFGYAVRRIAYRCLFKSVARDVTIGRNVTFRGAGRISIGRGVFIDDNCVIDARGAGASVEIGDGVLIGRNTIVRCRGQSLTIGAGTDIGCNCIIATDSRLSIGREVLVAAYTYVAAGGIHKYEDKTIPIIRQGFESRGGVTISDDVWIGAYTIVLDGVTVGKGCVVGAHSLVNKSIPDMSVAHGVPAKVQRSR